MKKHFLSVYLKEENKKVSQQGAISNKKRTAACALFESVQNVDPRPKYRRISIDTWKDACKNACHTYDESLPSLEEATELFGFGVSATN